MKKLLLGLSIVLLVVYLAGVGIFHFFSFPNTYVNGENVSFQEKSQVFHKDWTKYSLTISGRKDKTDTIKATDIQYQENISKDVDLKQNSFLWFMSLFRKDNYEVDFNPSYDEAALDELIAGMNLMNNVTEPVNATIVKGANGYEIAKEVQGDQLDTEVLKEVILQAFLDRSSEVKLDNQYNQPKVLSDDAGLKEKLAKINAIKDLTITYSFGNQTEVLKEDALMALFDETDNDYLMSEEKMTEYITGLAMKYDTLGKPHYFKTTEKGLVTIEGGIYGWAIDVEESVKQLKALMERRESVTIQPVYARYAMARNEDGSDIGNTYIEVDLDGQHLWFYKNGQLLVDSDIVTGNPNRGVATPTGVDMIWSKEKDKYLQGINPEGTDNYSSFVDFWMPVNWLGVGIHNSRWRTDFGGNIYIGGGSFGCINTPYETSKIIYENVDIGTPVVIY